MEEKPYGEGNHIISHSSLYFGEWKGILLITIGQKQVLKKSVSEEGRCML